jgi:hypothetical protein
MEDTCISAGSTVNVLWVTSLLDGRSRLVEAYHYRKFISLIPVEISPRCNSDSLKPRSGEGRQSGVGERSLRSSTLLHSPFPVFPTLHRMEWLVTGRNGEDGGRRMIGGRRSQGEKSPSVRRMSCLSDVSAAGSTTVRSADQPMTSARPQPSRAPAIGLK